MSTIVTRSGKGSPLTHTEVDNNFTNLNTDKLQSGDTAASLTITSADINGGTIDGATIGASSASSGVFTSLSDSGNLTFTGTGNRITGDFSNATIANRVVFQSSTTNGATGITAAPNGTGVISSWNAQNSSDINNSATIAMRASDVDMSLRSGILGTGTYLPLTMYTGGSERLRIDTSGNLGIGTANPSTKLDVSGNLRFSASNPAIELNNGGPQVYSTVANTLQFATGGGIGTATERMRIDSSGNVGIGTSSPSAKLSIAGSTASDYTTGMTFSKSGGNTYAIAPDANDLFVRSVTGGTEVCRFTYGGNLLVGTTSNASGYRLYVNGGNDRGMQLDSPSGSGVYSTLNFAQNGSIQTQLFWFSTTDEFIIQNTSGGVKLTNGATSWASASDERLKDIIEPIANAAEKVSSLRAVIGKYKTDSEEKRRTFLIAQDVQAVLPEAVYSAQQARSEDKTEYLHLQYTDTIPLLVAAIQELKAEVDALKAQINQ
jgi:hypothetical protein